jgi:hypothetical protein
MATSAHVLTEDGTTTLDGVMASAPALSGTTAAALLDIWRRRRAEPALLVQPKEQWREGRSSATRGFAGYKPGSVPLSRDVLVSDDSFVRRLRSAAIDDDGRKKWPTFD